MSRRSQLTRGTLSVLAFSVPFAICHPAWVAIDAPFVRSIAINAVLFVMPGLAWVSSARFTDLTVIQRVFWTIAASLIVFSAGIVLTFLIGQTLTAAALWNFTWAVTVLGCLANSPGGGALPTGTVGRQDRAWAACAVFALAYVLFYVGATRLVPPQGDHDLDLQGTAYALLTRLTPSYNTPRGSNYLAHPPLLHAYVAGSFLYFNKLDELRVYDAASTTLAVGSEWRHYLQKPFLVETRTPNIFLGALTVAVLFFWIAGSLGSWLAAVMVAAYASLPEAFVRFSYGGYFAISQFSILLIVIAVADWRSDQRRLARWWGTAAVAAYAAWANHKLVFIPFSAGLWYLLRPASESRLRTSFGHPVVAGFLFGSAAFWLYGLWVNAGDFWNDHVRTHIVERAIRAGQGGEYLSAGGLWLELLRDTSYLLVPAGLVALALLVLRRSPLRDLGGFLTVWAVGAALAFTMVDWKMTKHLAEIFLLAPVIALAVATRAGLVARPIAQALGLATLAINSLALVKLSYDFASIVKLPEW